MPVLALALLATTFTLHIWDTKLGLEFTRQAGGRLTVSCRTR
ncbi:MAG TPA: hypothetical protein VMJ49_05885 [Gaiellaceae bacterium]|nr:hypothetical protein [Gaiellaceae bacterium]